MRNLGPNIKANNTAILPRPCNVQTNMGISLLICRVQKTDHLPKQVAVSGMFSKEKDDRDQI